MARLVSFPLDERTVVAIAARVDAWLALPVAEREAAGEDLRETADRLWSWRGVARTVLRASAGELDDLRHPVEP